MGSKQDLYAAITNRITEALEAGGTVPWNKPWRSSGGFPISLSTKRPYRGINVLLLAIENYADPRWGTYRAIDGLGGQVRKGQKGTQIVFWKRVSRRPKDDDDNGGSYWMLRHFTVFNASQADGLPELEVEETREFTPIEEAQKIVDGYVWDPSGGNENIGPPVLGGYNAALYNPARDVIQMPAPEDFFLDESYYSTLFHEMIHSSGHEKRLKRIEPALFGTDPYAKEELVAEIGASFLGGVAGFETAGGDQSAAYVAGWLKPLQDDPKLIVTAAGQAQKAADLILGTTFDDESANADSDSELVAA